MKRLRVLLVPDWLEWVTGTIARDIARYNPWISATILSGPVLRRLTAANPALIERFDLVHFLCPYASGDWLPLLRGTTPVVTSHFHVTDWAEISHNIKGDAILALSSEWVRDLQARGAPMERVVMCPPGIDTTLFRPRATEERIRTRARLGLQSKGPLIVFFSKHGSNDSDRKGTDIFVRGATLLTVALPGSCFLVTGPGWGQLTAELRERGVRCEWVPFVVTRAGVAELHGAADFYWVTSRVEGGPLPLLEAMSSGTCCLTTPVGCAADLMEDGVNGFVVPFESSSAFVETTLAAWSRPDLRARIGLEARATILEHADARDTSRRMAEAYRIAIDSFAGKHAGYERFDIPAMPTASRERVAVRGESEVSREALDLRSSRRAAMLEKLLWAEHLSLDDSQWRESLRLILRAWLIDPGSLEPPSMLMRHVLPARVVEAIVRGKHWARISAQRLRSQSRTL